MAGAPLGSQTWLAGTSGKGMAPVGFGWVFADISTVMPCDAVMTGG